MARTYKIEGRAFQKVADRNRVHVVEVDVGFWKGDKSWLHRTVAGESIGGVPVSLQRVNCSRCRGYIERLRKEGVGSTSNAATEWLRKPAHQLFDHDVIRHHGMVDWVAGYPHDQVAVHVHSQSERGSYTLLLQRSQDVEYRR